MSLVDFIVVKEVSMAACICMLMCVALFKFLGLAIFQKTLAQSSTSYLGAKDKIYCNAPVSCVTYL